MIPKGQVVLDGSIVAPSDLHSKKGEKKAFSLITKERDNYIFLATEVTESAQWIDTIKKGNEQYTSSTKTVGTLTLSVPQGRKLLSKQDTVPNAYAIAYIEKQQFWTRVDHKTANPVWYYPYDHSKSEMKL